MTTERFIEHRITRDLLRRRERAPAPGNAPWVERLITCLLYTSDAADDNRVV